MSQEDNTNLLERGYELAEEFVSHPSGIDKSILAAINSGDLEKVRYQISKCEGYLAQEHFYGTEQVRREVPDVY